MSFTHFRCLFLQLNYREAYHKEKHMYTTILDTHDYARCHNLKEIYSNVCLRCVHKTPTANFLLNISCISKLFCSK